MLPTATLAIVSTKLSEVKSIVESSGISVTGLFRMSLLHSVLDDIIPDFFGMPLMKIMIVEVLAVVVESHGIDPNDCNQVV